MSEISSSSPASAPPLYGRFAVRLRGLVIDAAILAGFAVAVVIAVDVIESATLSGILMPLMLAIVLLYDPVMVARFGGTIGHRVVNLRVADSRTEQRVGFFRALIRSILKTFLGLLSFFFIETRSTRPRTISPNRNEADAQLDASSRCTVNLYVRPIRG